jgi:hypothetical protein
VWHNTLAYLLLPKGYPLEALSVFHLRALLARCRRTFSNAWYIVLVHALVACLHKLQAAAVSGITDSTMQNTPDVLWFDAL